MNGPLPPGASPLLPDLWHDEAEPPARGGVRNRPLALAGGLFAALFLLAAVVPIDGAVIGSGEVGFASRVKRIAHPTGGVVSAILVRNGERVQAGQLLVRLDDSVSGVASTYSALTLDQLLAQRARLEAERLGAPRIAFPRELATTTSADARRAMAEENRLFDLRAAEHRQLRAQLEARIAQFGESIHGMEAQIDALNRQRTLIQPELEGVRNLWERRLVTINRLNMLERTAVELDGGMASQRAQIAQVRARITETREQLIQLEESRRADAAAELARVNTALNDQRLRRASADDQHRRNEIRAPHAGTVEKLALASAGDVVRPAEPVMEIVPTRDTAIIETAISPTDIDQVKTGQPARIRFSAFNLATTPEIRGTVVYVATNRSDVPEAGGAFYTVRVRIDSAAVARERLTLRSGMPAEVYIETGRRSLLSFATKPLRDQIARTFRSE